jgi:hypothetical protein
MNWKEYERNQPWSYRGTDRNVSLNEQEVHDKPQST